MKVSLTITVDYDIGEADRSDAFATVDELLGFIADNAAANGLLSGDTDLTVRSWEYLVEPVEE